MRTSARYMGIAAGAFAAALLVTGCGGDSGGGSDETSAKPSGERSSAPAGGDSGGKVSGAYVAQAGGKPLVLYIVGGKATLAGLHTCSGDYSGDQLSLKCADGNTDRTEGKVTPSADGKSLKVDWDALAASEDDTFIKSDSPGGLPSGMPSGFPTDFPTDIPGLESVGGATGG